MLHEKVGKHGTWNRGRYQVAQSWLNRLYRLAILIKTEIVSIRIVPGIVLSKDKTFIELRKAQGVFIKVLSYKNNISLLYLSWFEKIRSLRFIEIWLSIPLLQNDLKYQFK